MLYTLSLFALLSFLTHVFFMIATFARGRFNAKRYTYSHIFLWITGLLVFLMALSFQGKGVSDFLDYFDTPLKKGLILAATAGVSLLAHGIVKFLVQPARTPSRE